jgi:hypothetical protein
VGADETELAGPAVGESYPRRMVDTEHVQDELEALRAVAREAAAYLDLEELEDSAIAAGEGSPLWALKVALTGLIQTFPCSLEES